MSWGNRNRTQGGWRPGRGIASDWAACVVALALLMVSLPALAGPRVWAQHGAQARHAAPARQAPARQAPARPPAGRRAEPARNDNAARPGGNPGGNAGGNAGAAAPSGNAGEGQPGPANPAEMRPGVGGGSAFMGGRNGADRPGHLGQWLMNHQNLPLQQQEDQLRREPGFNRLRPEEQQRVLNRLRTLESRPPAQRQRMLGRVEMFERLSPQQKADVRASSQALAAMAPDRHRMVGRAFADLRQIPPDQRAAILNSARFQQEFSPEERQVLGNLLSIEPYEPR